VTEALGGKGGWLGGVEGDQWQYHLVAKERHGLTIPSLTAIDTGIDSCT